MWRVGDAPFDKLFSKKNGRIFEKQIMQNKAFNLTMIIVVQVQFNDASEGTQQKVAPYLITFFSKFNECLAVTSSQVLPYDVTGLRLSYLYSIRVCLSL